MPFIKNVQCININNDMFRGGMDCHPGINEQKEHHAHHVTLSLLDSADRP
jgi:hypothetical protein